MIASFCSSVSFKPIFSNSLITFTMFPTSFFPSCYSGQSGANELLFTP
nr:MAG TPA: hypothetical protein [Caudoviricetes sp.]